MRRCWGSNAAFAVLKLLAPWPARQKTKRKNIAYFRSVLHFAQVHIKGGE